ncbi:MAG: hypothetical protein FJ293_03025 [Planctomycetes bacterium]|nr:hypothetical protein [Planctomycetota bacterium]
MKLARPCLFAAALVASDRATGQVHYHEDGRPWSERAHAGPDAEVPGWYYHLGLSGMRVELVADAPTHLVVRHVFAGSPAAGVVQVGDHVVGAAGRAFATPHRNGYGMKVFGPAGPLLDFAEALEACQGAAGDGRLELQLLRAGTPAAATLAIGKRFGAFAPSFPADCPKSAALLAGLLEHLLAAQREDGSFGDPIRDTFAPLALLASDAPGHRAAVLKNVRFHAATTAATDRDDLIHWRYMAAAIVMSEYQLATGDAWLVPELEQVRDFLLGSQYVSLQQVNPKVKEGHPDSWPTDARQQHGGWGHNPGFEGYGPIAMVTAQGALAFALMSRCGVAIPRERHAAALDFLARGTGRNGYLWYADSVAGEDDWADMGRTGASAIACHLAPFDVAKHRALAQRQTAVIGAHPESFPDTHGSPLMGMGYAALAANLEPASWRRLLDSNRWWFTLAQCSDGTFCYQPNRDNAGYGADARDTASAVVAFILSIPKRNLVMTGQPPR